MSVFWYCLIRSMVSDMVLTKSGNVLRVVSCSRFVVIAAVSWVSS